MSQEIANKRNIEALLETVNLLRDMCFKQEQRTNLIQNGISSLAERLNDLERQLMHIRANTSPIK